MSMEHLNWDDSEENDDDGSEESEKENTPFQIEFFSTNRSRLRAGIRENCKKISISIKTEEPIKSELPPSPYNIDYFEEDYGDPDLIIRPQTPSRSNGFPGLTQCIVVCGKCACSLEGRVMTEEIGNRDDFDFNLKTWL